MLKTQITGAKYLSPQTNQMTNLNIAVPADSKDTEFGTSDILLAKDVIAYMNTLDSDISKELATKANKSDVLLKKSDSGGYYIEENSNALGLKAFAANNECTASGDYSYAEGAYTTASGGASHAEGDGPTASGGASHAEGESTRAIGYFSHAEGILTKASGFASHAEGAYNTVDTHAIHSVGIGTNDVRKNAEYIYIGTDESDYIDDSDPKHGYKYLIGVGGYDGISTDTSTYKSIQEVIADLTAHIEQLETKVKALEDANTPA